MMYASQVMYGVRCTMYASLKDRNCSGVGKSYIVHLTSYIILTSYIALILLYAKKRSQKLV
jgi:hypothetical protein